MTTHEPITVRHRFGSYDIRFLTLPEAVAELPGDAVVITDHNVGRLYGERFAPDIRSIAVTPGEQSKNAASWAWLQSQLAIAKTSRATSVVAFGGGVVGDLAGFVAATYMRGVPLIQIPTSLLAQVDSSVGGKVGIDLPEGKNHVGSFYPPQAVLICVDVLGTLPEREFRNGMAEVWKYGFILDAGLVDLLRTRNFEVIDIVRRCVELKRDVVEADEFETLGERAKLNFGHTVGHAIEKLTGYGPVLHGEAISIGMVVEAAIGEAIGLTERGTGRVIEECLGSQGLPTTSIVLRDVEAFIEAMRHDKKARAGRLAFSLLTTVGRCKLIEDVPEKDVRTVLAEL